MQLETVDNEGNVGAVYRPPRRLPKKRLQERPLKNRLPRRPRPSGKLRRPLDRHNSNSKRSKMCIMRIALKSVRLVLLRCIKGSLDTTASWTAITMAWTASNGFDISATQRLFGPPSGNIK